MTAASSRRCCARTAFRPSPASTPGHWHGTCVRRAASARSSPHPARPARSAAIEAARAVPRWEDQDFVGQVSPPKATNVAEPGEGGPLVAVLDFGLKTNIIRNLRQRGARVRVLPYSASAAEALAADVDGLVLSPGPGDPARLAGPSRSPERPSRTAGRCWASAWAIRSWAARPAPTPPAALRPPRREPSGPATSTRASSGHRPEPRVPGRGRDRCRASGFQVSQST